MSDSAKRISRLAVLTALGVVLLLLTNVVPAGKLGLMALASLPVCVSLMMYDRKWAAGVFAVTAVLGFLLFPGTTAIGYALFFGYYPIAKSLFERVRGTWQPWVLKLALYSAAFAAYWYLAGALIGGADAVPWYIVFGIGAVVFVVYDLCYSLIICFYLDKIARYFP